jgi:hypothetical protein
MTERPFCREIGNLALEANTLNNQGAALRYVGDEPSARRSFERALAINTTLGYGVEAALTRINPSCCARREGDFDEARSHLSDAIKEFQGRVATVVGPCQQSPSPASFKTEVGSCGAIWS